MPGLHLVLLVWVNSSPNLGSLRQTTLSLPWDFYFFFSLLSASNVLNVTLKCTKVQFNFLFISCFLIGKWQKLCPGNKSSLFAYCAVIGLNIDGLAKSHCILVVIGYANWVLLLGFWIVVWFSVAVAHCAACWGMFINQHSPNNYQNLLFKADEYVTGGLFYYYIPVPHTLKMFNI